MAPLDVAPAQLYRQAELLRGLTEPQRSELVAGLCMAGRQLAEAGVRARNPKAGQPLVRWLLTAVIYGESTARRLHGEKPAA